MTVVSEPNTVIPGDREIENITQQNGRRNNVMCSEEEEEEVVEEKEKEKEKEEEGEDEEKVEESVPDSSRIRRANTPLSYICSLKIKIITNSNPRNPN